MKQTCKRPKGHTTSNKMTGAKQPATASRKVGGVRAPCSDLVGALRSRWSYARRAVALVINPGSVRIIPPRRGSSVMIHEQQQFQAPSYRHQYRLPQHSRGVCSVCAGPVLLSCPARLHPRRAAQFPPYRRVASVNMEHSGACAVVLQRSSCVLGMPITSRSHGVAATGAFPFGRCR